MGSCMSSKASKPHKIETTKPPVPPPKGRSPRNFELHSVDENKLYQKRIAGSSSARYIEFLFPGILTLV